MPLPICAYLSLGVAEETDLYEILSIICGSDLQNDLFQAQTFTTFTLPADGT